MPKGHFTQSTAVLLANKTDVDALARALSEFEIVRRTERSPDGWMGGLGVVVAMRPEANGYVLVDVVDEPWPDGMGDPKKEATLFGAWCMGFFGPFIFPGNLGRARAMSFAWREGEAVAERHRAFVRIKSSYVLGADDDALCLPADYAPLPELELVTDITRAVLSLPGALAYFNPNGEVLRSRAGLDDELAWHRERQLTPLPAWTNVRVWKLDEHPGWTAMDTIGMDQLDVDDHEACFPTGAYAPQHVDNFLRNATDYVRQNGAVIEDGNTMDGPGGIRWAAHTIEESLAPRPRRVLRWLPCDGSKVPQGLRP